MDFIACSYSFSFQHIVVVCHGSYIRTLAMQASIKCTTIHHQPADVVNSKYCNRRTDSKNNAFDVGIDQRPKEYLETVWNIKHNHPSTITIVYCHLIHILICPWYICSFKLSLFSSAICNTILPCCFWLWDAQGSDICTKVMFHATSEFVYFFSRFL